MFTNCIAKILHQCQRAVRAQNSSSGALNYVDKRLPRGLNEWFNIGLPGRVSRIRIVNVIGNYLLTKLWHERIHFLEVVCATYKLITVCIHYTYSMYNVPTYMYAYTT